MSVLVLGLGADEGSGGVGLPSIVRLLHAYSHHYRSYTHKHFDEEAAEKGVETLSCSITK